jgi:hypothetical protein
VLTGTSSSSVQINSDYNLLIHKRVIVFSRAAAAFLRERRKTNLQTGAGSVRQRRRESGDDLDQIGLAANAGLFR